jgi:CheY-specific phosphatase CheX
MARRGEVTPLRGDEIRAEVSVAVRITGDSEGDVIISMDTGTALGICSILLGLKIDSLTPGALDALAELGNMIAGNAVTELNDLGFDFIMNIPFVTAGSGNRACGNREAVQIPLVSDCGEMNINILFGAD